jgi:hypothetical protein
MTLKVKYLGEFKVIFKLALGYESEDQMGLIHEKKRSKILRDYPFKTTITAHAFVFRTSYMSTTDPQIDGYKYIFFMIVQSLRNTASIDTIV